MLVFSKLYGLKILLYFKWKKHGFNIKTEYTYIIFKIEITAKM